MMAPAEVPEISSRTLDEATGPDSFTSSFSSGKSLGHQRMTRTKPMASAMTPSVMSCQTGTRNARKSAITSSPIVTVVGGLSRAGAEQNSEGIADAEARL